VEANPFSYLLGKKPCQGGRSFLEPLNWGDFPKIPSAALIGDSPDLIITTKPGTIGWTKGKLLVDRFASTLQSQYSRLVSRSPGSSTAEWGPPVVVESVAVANPITIPFKPVLRRRHRVSVRARGHRRPTRSGRRSFHQEVPPDSGTIARRAQGVVDHFCTHALEMAALLLDLQPGDEVIIPSFTFVSTVNAFVLRGARPCSSTSGRIR